MSIRANPGSRRILRILLITVCVLVAGAGLAGVLAARHHFRLAATSQPQLLAAASGPAQIVRFTIYDAGIFPREARAGVGLIALHFEDMSEGSAGLVVANESFQPLAQVVRRPQRSRGKIQLSLAPGTYTVFDASRPLNRARLIIEP